MAGPMPPKESRRSLVASVQEGTLALSNSAAALSPAFGADAAGGALWAFDGGAANMKPKSPPKIPKNLTFNTIEIVLPKENYIDTKE